MGEGTFGDRGVEVSIAACVGEGVTVTCGKGVLVTVSSTAGEGVLVTVSSTTGEGDGVLVACGAAVEAIIGGVEVAGVEMRIFGSKHP